MEKQARRVKFGWIAPLTASEENKQLPILMAEEEEVLPAVARHFDSVWAFDHLLGFGDLDSAYLESWTVLTWLAARYPDILIGHLVMARCVRDAIADP